MKMLQEYWASTIIFIGIFSQCIFMRLSAFLCIDTKMKQVCLSLLLLYKDRGNQTERKFQKKYRACPHNESAKKISTELCKLRKEKLQFFTFF